MTPSTLRNTALTCVTRWQWPVLPGAGLRAAAPTEPEVPGRSPVRCACPDPDCAVPGGHPLDPVLLAATTDAGMVRWWWTRRPSAPLLLATGGRAPCAVSLPAAAGARALAEFDRCGIRLGPVTATATRWTVLVAPYALPELGELLYAQDLVPGSLRFHSEGGYIVLPPSVAGPGRAGWVRSPDGGCGSAGAPWLPRAETLLGVLVEASVTTPGSGSSLTY